ncbi:MAG: DUF3188 domain-containing protein [Prochlorococcaceae cyanobacterium]
MTSKPVRSRPLLDGLMVFAAPLLILLALAVLLQRQGRDRIQALPALAIGSALVVASRVRRQRRRRALLLALRQERR